MTSINFGLSLFLYLACLLSLTNAAPQQPLQSVYPTQECSKTLGDAVGAVLRSCAMPVDILKRNLTALPTNPDDQIRLFVAASNTFCTANCSDEFAKVTQEVESKCSTPNPSDENALWFFKHGLFGSKLFCQKEGDQLCINKVIQQASQLKRLEIVLPLVMPLFTYNHMNAMIKIFDRDSHGWFEAGLSLMEDMMRLPGELICGNCQKTIGAQAYSYFTDVYKPQVIDKLKRFDLSSAVNSMVGLKKCTAPTPAPKSIPAYAQMGSMFQ